MTPARSCTRTIAAVVALAMATPAAADNPGTYLVGNIPVAGAVGTIELPLGRGWATELGAGVLSQGTYTDGNPFAYLAAVAPTAFFHFDGIEDLRLTLGFQEFLWQAIPPLGIKATHEERGVARARYQQPRGTAAIYEMVQLDVRSFDDPTGVHRIVWRPRFRVGQGFNLDAARINSLVFYEEVAFRFAAPGYTARHFEFLRGFVGWLWTTRRGTFVSLGLVAQVSLNPPATRYDVLWGPVLGISHWFRSAPKEAPPSETTDVDL